MKKKRKPGLTSPVFHAKIILAFGGSHCGEVSEWFMELVLKTSDSRKRTMGSNPILSAIFLNHQFTLTWSNTQEVEEAPLLRA